MSMTQPKNIEQWAAHYGVETIEFLKLLWTFGMTVITPHSLIEADTASYAWSLREARQAAQTQVSAPVCDPEYDQAVRCVVQRVPGAAALRDDPAKLLQYMLRMYNDVVRRFTDHVQDNPPIVFPLDDTCKATSLAQALQIASILREEYDGTGISNPRLKQRLDECMSSDPAQDTRGLR